MKKFYFLFVLLFGLSIMTSCEKDEEVEKTEKTEKSEKSDEERFIGTWVGDEATIVFKKNGTGYWDDDEEREDFTWEINEKKQTLYIEYEDGYSFKVEYEFKSDKKLWVEGETYEKE